MDIALLIKEKNFLRHQFPTVSALNDPPTIYEGLLRCETGEVKQLANEGLWPFTEYVEWNRFRLELPNEYPLRPPVATWLTDIHHPNIVPKIPNAVCISILGDKWNPSLTLASIINGLYYLLADPNPYNVFDAPSCIKAAEVCRRYGFPKMAKMEKPKENDVVRFNIIPVPGAAQGRSSDLLRFRILRRR